MKLTLFLLLLLYSCNSPSANQTNSNPAQAKAIPTNNPERTRAKTAIQGDIRCALQDKAGHLWFGTHGQGLYRLDSSAAPGTLVHFTMRDGLPGNTITSLLEDKAGIIWIGTESGLSRFDLGAARTGSSAFTPFPLPVSTTSNSNPFPEKTIDSKQNTVRSMMQDKSGKIWIGTDRDGVYCYDGKLVTHFLHQDGVENKGNLRLEAVNTILQDRSGDIWLTTWFEGLCRFDGKVITAFKPNNEVWFTSILEDREGTLWIGRRGKGLVRFNGKEFTNVQQHGTLDSCGVSPEAEDKQGNLWFTTIPADLTRRDKSGGLWRYNPSAAKTPGAGSFTNFTPKDGLKNYNVLCVLADRSGTIWVSTRGSGLYRYNPSAAAGTGAKAFTSYSEL